MTKVLIIGLGKIGKAHLNAIKGKNQIKLIDIVEKKQIPQKFIGENINKISFQNSLNKKYDLIILATNSFERYGILEKLIKYKNYKFILCEKFIFTKKEHYKKKFYKKNIYINTWGKTLFYFFKNKIKSNFDLEIQIDSNSMITNTIHFIDFFFKINGFQRLRIFSKLNKVSSKRKGYNEFTGELNFIGRFSKIKINTVLREKFININLINKMKNYSIVFNFKNKLIIFKKKNYIKRIKLNKIFVSNTTLNLVNNLNKSYLKKNFSKYEELSEISSNLLLHLTNKFDRKIRIT